MTYTRRSPIPAFSAFERSMLRPIRWPPTRHDAPTLWQRAKAMFATMLATIVSTASLAQRLQFGRSNRRALLARLVPVEKLVRALMMIDAATFLLMTPEGRRLRAETPKIEPPAPPRPTGFAQTQPSTRIPMPGWQTIAAYHPYIDPRVVEREAREKRDALERRLAELQARASEVADAASWRCRFPVLHWVHPEDARTHVASPHRATQTKLLTFNDDPFSPRAATLARTSTSSSAPDATDAPHADACDLARRIEALSRILANPAPAIHRLARRLAALPAEALTAPEMTSAFNWRWADGNRENWNACNLAEPAFRALVASATHKHDPG